MSMRCSVCGGPLPAERGMEHFPGKAPKLCSEKCIRTAIEAYWERLGSRAIGVFLQYGDALRYRLHRVVPVQRSVVSGQ